MLSKAAKSFAFDVSTLRLISNSTNAVYRFTKNSESFILRLSEKPPAYAEKIRGELDWLQFLGQNGIRVSLPVRTIDHDIMAVFAENETCFIATVFEPAPGTFFDKNDPLLWGEAVFKRWGETMGKMHRLSRHFKPSNDAEKREDWSRWKIGNPYLRHGKYAVLLEKLRKLENIMDSLPREGNAYGLIHNDFHPYNFHIDGDLMTVFDFDDCLYGWFSLDIAIAAAHAVWWGSPKEDRKSKNEFAKKFLNDFLEGYFKHYHLDRDWIQRIPMFMDYRNICSFFWWLHHWNGDENNLNDAQKKAIDQAVRLIENGRSFDGCEFRI
ncbi:phosphotransferase [Paenibacillus sp. VCA1]|uniref:phosphotransferase enzyme family protein n=1 Tax=Paenibacillus sp. VCA1 TaxID=3039148 RepID=UPI002870BBEE|nr:phosphotransferase [Paenibacillus sp. VCA1]MDR9854711.1 phosphotransferase [Paenibacillus sp. VCA1]